MVIFVLNLVFLVKIDRRKEKSDGKRKVDGGMWKEEFPSKT